MVTRPVVCLLAIFVLVFFRPLVIWDLSPLLLVCHKYYLLHQDFPLNLWILLFHGHISWVSFSSLASMTFYNLQNYFLFFGHAMWHVGILVSWPGIEPVPVTLKHGVLTTGPQWKSPQSSQGLVVTLSKISYSFEISKFFSFFFT